MQQGGGQVEAPLHPARAPLGLVAGPIGEADQVEGLRDPVPAGGCRGRPEAAAQKARFSVSVSVGKRAMSCGT